MSTKNTTAFTQKAAACEIWNLKICESYDIHVRGPLLTCESRAAIKADSDAEHPQAKQTEDTELDLTAVEENKETPSTHNEAKGSAVPQGLPSFPIQTVLGSVQDESLKKLLMSWYYAGYYTGLYEGQQQTQQNHGS
ncbi:hypothetical protein ACHAP5_006296 [Fusarium lateritium]